MHSKSTTSTINIHQLPRTDSTGYKISIGFHQLHRNDPYINPNNRTFESASMFKPMHLLSKSPPLHRSMPQSPSKIRAGRCPSPARWWHVKYAFMTIKIDHRYCNILQYVILWYLTLCSFPKILGMIGLIGLQNLNLLWETRNSKLFFVSTAGSHLTSMSGPLQPRPKDRWTNSYSTPKSLGIFWGSNFSFLVQKNIHQLVAMFGHGFDPPIFGNPWLPASVAEGGPPGRTDRKHC